MRNLRFQTLLVCASTLGWFVTPITLPAQNQVIEEGFGKYFGLESSYEPESWPRHFRVGALVGFNLKADFTMSGTFTFPGQNANQTGRGRNNEFDDGFVRVDATGNDMDATYFWSYENANQYKPAQNRLEFHSSSSYSSSSSGSATADPKVGFDTAYGGHLFRMGSALVGWEFGFGYLPIKIVDKFSSAANVTQSLYWYDTSNLGPAFFEDNGTFLGSYTGTAAGPGAKLDDLATLDVGGVSIIPTMLTGTRTLDVTLYNFRLGPTLHWELHPRIAVAVSGGAAMGIITGDLKFNEALSVAGNPNNSGSFSDTEITYGGYVAAKLMYHAVKNGDFYIGLQYMPLGSATFSGGGRAAELDMSGGVYISAGINWPF